MSAAVKACPVTQEDREAAVDWYAAQHTYGVSFMEDVRTGGRDGDELVQAFARHRLATRPDRDQALEEDAEKLRVALENIVDNTYVGQHHKPVNERSRYGNYLARYYHEARAVLAALKAPQS